jgi:hypothetical protein
MDSMPFKEYVLFIWTIIIKNIIIILGIVFDYITSSVAVNNLFYHMGIVDRSQGSAHRAAHRVPKCML